MVHVIMCNDAVMGAHIGEEADASSQLEAKACADFDRNHWDWEDKFRKYSAGCGDAYALYRRFCYWRLVTVEATS